MVAPIIEEEKKQEMGRPRRDTREVLNGILWILRTGAPWKDLPTRYPPYQTCHRRFQEWSQNETFARILATLAQDMEERGQISLEECFIDGTFVSAQKGGLVLDVPNGERGRRSWQSQMRNLFQSPSVWPLLLDTKLPWWNQRLTADIRAKLQRDLSEIKHMTAIPMMK